MAESMTAMATHVHAGGDVYAQRIISESPALLALFHVRQPIADLSNLRRKPVTTSCLRKISAYNGGFHVLSEDSAAIDSESGHERSVNSRVRVMKKRLSFADQHGGQLVLEREFREGDAPIYCNNVITHKTMGARADPHSPRSSIAQRLLRGAFGVGGGCCEENKTRWSQPEMLSLCLLSCSLVTVAVLGLVRQAHSTT